MFSLFPFITNFLKRLAKRQTYTPNNVFPQNSKLRAKHALLGNVVGTWETGVSIELLKVNEYPFSMLLQSSFQA